VLDIYLPVILSVELLRHLSFIRTNLHVHCAAFRIETLMICVYIVLYFSLIRDLHKYDNLSIILTDVQKPAAQPSSEVRVGTGSRGGAPVGPGSGQIYTEQFAAVKCFSIRRSVAESNLNLPIPTKKHFGSAQIP